MLVSQADLRIFFSSTDVAAPAHELVDHAFEGEREEELWIGGSPVRLHFDMIKNVIAERREFDHLIKISKACEWAVAATLVLLDSLEPALLEEVFRAQWHRVPVERWIPVLKDKLTLPLRSGIFGEYQGDGIRSLRNMMNVTARVDAPADWHKELFERGGYFVQKCVWSDEYAPYSAWPGLLEHLTLELAKEHVKKMGRSRRLETISEWWASRHHSTPTGSSSERKPVQDSLLADPLFNPTDRPNKKAVVEALDDDHMEKLLAQLPETHCRLSTKREPGMKNRPLHANNDISFFIEAYALVHAEKELDGIKGCYGKQMPVDVLHWMQQAEKVDHNGGIWVSLDYPNYCTFHAKWELALASYARAEAWKSSLQPELVKKQKALCSMWIAEGHFNSIMKEEGEDSWMFNENGLYSGQRATLLDHDYMHQPNAETAVIVAADMGWDVEPEESWYTGDDEDAWFKALVKAMGYVAAHALCGNKFQPLKQVSGRVRSWAHREKKLTHYSTGRPIDLDDATHSYLQRDLSRAALPTRPLARILATLASGNWYAEPGIWYDSAISSTSDNFWECVTRGLELNKSQKLAAAFLDRLMVVRPTQEDGPDVKVKKLEWRAYASKGDHPLWRGSGFGTKETPIMVTKPRVHESWPSKATESWMRRMEPYLRGLRDSRVEMYRTYLLKESVGASFHHYRMRAMRDAARAYWPERYSVGDWPVRILPLEPTRSFLLRKYRQIPARRRPISEDELYARLGIDVYLFNLVGATRDLFANLRPQDWSKWCKLTIKYKIRPELELTDGSIQSWAANVSAFDPSLHLDESIPRRTHFLCVYAANGAGKSWLADHIRGFCDMDVPVYAMVGWRLRARRYVRADDDDIKEAIATIRWAKKYDLPVILTQWPPPMLMRAAQITNTTLTWAAYDPGEDVRLQRLEAREYKDPLRVNELMDLATLCYDTLPEDAPVLTNAAEVIHWTGLA